MGEKKDTLSFFQEGLNEMPDDVQFVEDEEDKKKKKKDEESE